MQKPGASPIPIGSCAVRPTTPVGTQADLLDLKAQFPAFEQAPDAVFFDNASTTQKPDSVIAAIEKFYKQECANAGRAIYAPAMRATQKIETARQDVAKFLHAEASEIAFTAGATDSLNSAAWAWGLTNLNHQDEVMFCPQDHSSAVSPWRTLQLCLSRLGREIKLVPFEIHPVGDYDLRSIERAKSERTRVICLSHIHHVFGLDMEISEIRKIVGADVLISLDASQSVGHTTVDVQELDVDFASFSGHKMFAGNGVGVLFARRQRHNDIVAVKTGGRSAPIASDMDATIRSGFIDKIECGTPNIPGIASMSAAIDFINGVGLNSIEKHVSFLTSQLVDGLSAIPGIVFAPGPVPCGCPGGFGILSFRFEQASSFDIASALANENIFVRSGIHCRADERNSEDFIRVSMHAYNTLEDLDIFIQTLSEVVA